MAVQGAERVVDAIIQMFQDHLPAELDLIDAEQADGITLKDVEAYYTYRRALAKDTCYIEAWVETINNLDPSTLTYNSGRLMFDAQTIVRLTFINRQNLTADNMSRIMMRYGAAIARLWLEHPLLDTTDSQIQFSRPSTMRFYDEQINQDGMSITLNRISAEINVNVIEVNS